MSFVAAAQRIPSAVSKHHNSQFPFEPATKLPCITEKAWLRSRKQSPTITQNTGPSLVSKIPCQQACSLIQGFSFLNLQPPTAPPPHPSSSKSAQKLLIFPSVTQMQQLLLGYHLEWPTALKGLPEGHKREEIDSSREFSFRKNMS